ncbi:DUF2087 domain-containing protein [Demequina sp.]|uniref:DUF2087 domain-containing protein n=1 Tax=Demequina sp. TaxID=2050685 RepID=UPI003D0B1E8E
MTTGAERFLENGVLVRTPRRWDDRAQVYAYLAGLVFETPEATLSEREVMERLTPLAEDPLTVRRGWIDMRLVKRTPDGAKYWRAPAVP